MSDDRKLVRTSEKGIYKRGNHYVVRYRSGGKQRKAIARTLTAARDLKAKYRNDPRSGEASREPFADYATRWIESYSGRTSRGLRDSTRTDYRLAIAPVKALLATAFEDGDLPSNPAAGLRNLIPPAATEEEAERAKALSE